MDNRGKLNNKLLNVKGIHNPPIDEVCYLIYDNRYNDCIIIDPSCFMNIEAAIGKIDKTPSVILLTHEHCDHIDAVNNVIDKYHSRLICSEKCGSSIINPRKNLSTYYELLISSHGIENALLPEPFSVYMPDLSFIESYKFVWHDYDLSLTETPGHSPGSICICLNDLLFAGDSLLRDNPVVTRLPGGNRNQYEEITVPFFLGMANNITVFPGHGQYFKLGDNQFLQKYRKEHYDIAEENSIHQQNKSCR